MTYITYDVKSIVDRREFRDMRRRLGLHEFTKFENRAADLGEAEDD